MTVIVREPTVAAFDFDGTLTRGESFFRFLRHVTPLPRFVGAFVLSAPTIASYLLGWKDNETAKVIVLRHFLRGRLLSEVAPLADDFARKVIPRTVRPEALAGLRGHQKQGHVCILVSATLALYLRPWAEQAGFDEVLATELAVDAQGRLTGELASPNCYGPEKARRLQAHLGRDRIHSAYGDSEGDTEMLAMAAHPHFRPWR